jgi:hypothetical protein
MVQLTTRPKRAVRRLVDRVMLPYVEQLARTMNAQPSAVVQPAADASPPPPPAPPGAAGGVPTDYFHLINHELRTVELERLPKGARRALSVGASGRWYFDWFERSVGPLEVHVGVEAFEDEPEDLPGYVRWIPTTADRFEGVDDHEIDIVFAGQTSEHLWARELADFLIQSRRVLTADGLLVLDSPNRLVTEYLHWSHGGHTVELSAGEIEELLSMAGFRTESIRGLWRCRFGDTYLQLEERLDDGAMLVRRIVDGPDRPDDCFVWWIVARPGGIPDDEKLHARVVELFDQHWPTRVCRGMWPRTDDGIDVPVGVDWSTTSLPFMLHEGRWRIGIELAAGRVSDLEGLRVEIFSPGEYMQHRLVAEDATVDRRTAAWELDQSELMFALSMRVNVDRVASPVRLRMPLSIRLVGT